MLKRFYPDRMEASVYGIAFQEWYDKGFRGLIFDIDNTLVMHGADADEKAIQLMGELKKMGFAVCLLSNNKQERVERFNREIHVDYIFNAHKPSGGNYRRAMELMGTSLKDTLFIGDQLFTDVYGARRIGMANILVKPIDPKEEIQIVLKRYLEKIVLFFYNRKLRKQSEQ